MYFIKRRIALLYATLLLEWDLRVVEFFAGVQLMTIAVASVIYDLTHGTLFSEEPAFWVFVIAIAAVGVFQCSVYIRTYNDPNALLKRMPFGEGIMLNQLQHRYYAVSASGTAWLCLLALLLVHYMTGIPRFLDGFSTVWSVSFILPEVMISVASWAKLNEQRQKRLHLRVIQQAKRERHNDAYHKELMKVKEIKQVEQVKDEHTGIAPGGNYSDTVILAEAKEFMAAQHREQRRNQQGIEDTKQEK